LLGLFWKKTTNKGAITGVVLSIPIALALKFLPIDMPFIDQMFYTCLLTMAIIVMVSLCTCENEDDVKGIALTSSMFQTKRDFHIAAYAILILLVVIYAVFW
jgi:SSS family solute:Na+ symporter